VRNVPRNLLPKRPKLRRTQWMSAIMPSFDTVDIDVAFFEIYTRPLEGYQFRCTKSVTKHQQNNGGIAVTMPPYFSSSFDHCFDFIRSKILPFPL
jgi:hypothetical protein